MLTVRDGVSGANLPPVRLHGERRRRSWLQGGPPRSGHRRSRVRPRRSVGVACARRRSSRGPTGCERRARRQRRQRVHGEPRPGRRGLPPRPADNCSTAAPAAGAGLRSSPTRSTALSMTSWTASD